MAQVILKKEKNNLIALLQGEIDHHAAEILRLQIDESITTSQPDALVLDFSSVSFMDSSGIGLILGRHKLLKTIGGVLLVQNAPREAEKMLALAGIQAKE